MTSSDLNLDWLDLGRRPHPRAAEPLGRPGGRQGPRPGAAHGVRRRDMDYWVYDGKRYPSSGLSAVAGKSKEEFSPEPLPYSEMRPGCYDPTARLEDMDRAGILASLCFPTITRFCGQLFMEASDREFGFSACRPTTTGSIEEWCAAAPGRYIPLILIPMWDPPLAAKEMERMRGQGRRRRSASRRTRPRSGLPTIHDKDRYWDPVMATANELGDGGVHARRLLVAGPPDRSGLAVHGQPGLGGGPHLGRHAVLAVQRHVPALPEPEDRAVRGGDRLDALLPGAGRAGARQAALLGDAGRERSWTTPATDVDLDTLDIRGLFRDHVFGCFIEDHHGIASIDEIGEDNIMCETDYPHSDSTWPDCIAVGQEADRPSPARDPVQDPPRQRREAVPLHAGRAADARRVHDHGGMPTGVIVLTDHEGA